MKIDGDYLVFESGRRVYASYGIVGIGAADDGRPVTDGYDGGIPTVFDSWVNPYETRILSAAECVELADYMIARWQRFREVAEGEAPERDEHGHATHKVAP